MSCLPECTCDTCQEKFEVEWANRVSDEKLCMDCGMPMTMTLESLEKGQYIHFYLPCDACIKEFLEIMRANSLCPGCREPMQRVCVGCFCTEEDDCKCRQCVAARGDVKKIPIAGLEPATLGLKGPSSTD